MKSEITADYIEPEPFLPPDFDAFWYWLQAQGLVRDAPYDYVRAATPSAWTLGLYSRFQSLVSLAW